MHEKNQILSTVSIYHALTDGSVAVISILFIIFKTRFNLSYTEIGVITGGGLLLTLIAQLLIGKFTDGKNSRNWLSIGVFLTCISMLILTQCNGFLTLVVFIFFLRFSSSFFHPIGVGWISRMFKRNRLDWAMGIQSGSADVGAFIAVSTTLYFTELFSWDFPLYLWSVLCLCGLITGLILTKNICIESSHAPKKQKKMRFTETFHEAIKLIKRIKLLAFAFAISGCAWSVIITFLPLLLQERTTLPIWLIGSIVAVLIGVGSITSLSYGKISSMVKRRNLILFSYLTIGVMGMFFAYFTNVFILLGTAVFLGISVFLTYPALFSSVSEVTHESAEGLTFGITFTLQTGGGTIILFVSGFLSDIFGVWVPFALLGLLSLLLGVMLLFQWKKPMITSE